MSIDHGGPLRESENNDVSNLNPELARRSPGYASVLYGIVSVALCMYLSAGCLQMVLMGSQPCRVAAQNLVVSFFSGAVLA